MDYAAKYIIKDIDKSKEREKYYRVQFPERECYELRTFLNMPIRKTTLEL